MPNKIGSNSEKQAALRIKINETPGKGEGWKLMTSGTSGKDLL